MSFPSYVHYRDSGVEWIGRVPLNWRVARVADLASIVNGFPFDSKLFHSTEGVPLVRIRDLNKAATEVFYAGNFVAEAAVTADDVLIGMDGDFNVGRWRGLGKALLNQRMCCVRGRSPNITCYLEYALPIPLAAINAVTYSTTVKHLSSFQVEKIRITLPESAEELESILAFLDQETSKIDALISEQQRLIELLKEKRQAVISHAVTKGLNPDVRMKPSGVEWLGEVPEHWEVKKLKRESPFMSVGIVVNPSSFVSESDDGLPFIYGGDIREGQIDYLNSRRISSAASRTEEKTMLQEGDLLTVRVGAPGVTAVVPKECDGGNCASVMLMRKGAFNSDWLCYVMNARIVRFQVEIVQYGAAQQQFNISHAVNFLIPVPPRAEQDSLVAALDAQLDGFHRLQVEAEKAIGLLQERRTALISAAVTGKIDVLNYAATQKDAA